MELGFFDKAKALAHILRWRLTWNKRDVNFKPADRNNEKFMSAAEAVKMINNGDVVLSCGMAANARCSIFYWALKERFLAGEGPKGLTWVALGAVGSRGRVPGSLEELDFPEIIDRYIGGHLETVKAQLRLAQEGHIELHTMPQGVLGYSLEAQARGEDSILSEVGVGTFLDPRVGDGSVVEPGVGQSLIEVEGDLLRYRLPKLNAAMFAISYADKEGNLYADNVSTLTENMPGAQAVRANGGKVLASVSGIIEKDESRIYMPADMVDAVVVNPRSEQTASVPQRRYWKFFTVGANEDTEHSIAELKFFNETLKITPVRRPPELAVSRVAANLFTRVIKPGVEVNVGVGLPEEVCRLIREGGLTDDITFGSETGAWGGLPAPGIFFGATVNPKKMMSSAEIFHYWEDKLDVTLLGMLEADGDGNVNVSKRGEGPINYVGPGGFPDLVNSAKNIIFIGSWMANASFEIEDGEMRIAEPGEHKFKEKVGQITFSGKRALEKGKKVYYVTHVGVFRLTERGMELIEVMPGIDVEKDIVKACPMKMVLAEGGVKTISQPIVTGVGFKLKWG